MLGAARPGTLRLVLAPGSWKGAFRKFGLLPAGGSWADFATRMGFREVTHAEDRSADAYVAVFGVARTSGDTSCPISTGAGRSWSSSRRTSTGPRGASLRRGQPRTIRPLTRSLDAYMNPAKAPQRDEATARSSEVLGDAPGIALQGASVRG